MSKSDVTRIGPYKPPRLFIHEWMRKKGKTQVDITNRLELGSTGTISKWLKNPIKLDVERLSAIAWALDMDDVRDLYRDPERPTQEDLLRDLDPTQKTVLIEMIKGLKRA